MTTTLHKLSLPRNIISSANEEEEENDTFSRDLLRQFDKKRSRLHFELGFTSQEPSPESSIRISTPVSEYLNEEPIQLDEAEIQQAPAVPVETSPSNYSNNTSSRRSVSASDLLRRSSAYLKSKFDLLRRNKSQEDNLIATATNTIDTNKQPTKFLMKTTISIPSAQQQYSGTTTARSSYSPSLPPPNTTIITQYPPKPLVYSPIEPIIPSNTNDERTQKPLLHRLSMPLLRVYNDTSTSLTRNRSITSFVSSNRRRKSEPDNHTKRKLRSNNASKSTSKQQQ